MLMVGKREGDEGRKEKHFRFDDDRVSGTRVVSEGGRSLLDLERVSSRSWVEKE